MKANLSIYLWGCALALVLVLVGFVLVKFGVINSKNSGRKSTLAATLAAAIALWVIDRSHIVPEPAFFDVIILFAVLWFICFFLFWVGVAGSLKMFGPKHRHDFGESSILSMQFLESRMIDGYVPPDKHDPNFLATEVLEGQAPSQAGSEIPTPSQEGKKVVHIPVKRLFKG
ncbi:MAG: hypothetical protein WCH35_12235 [Comamonadaceae bacterium]